MDKWLIRGARIVDGTGSPALQNDILLENGRIAAIGSLGDGAAGDACVLDGSHLVACPGFIDMHSHQGQVQHYTAGAGAKVLQGVTTEVVEVPGQDRSTCVADPIDWLEQISADATATNRAVLYSYRSLRRVLMDQHGKLAVHDRVKMAGFAKQLLKAGAFGVAVDFADETCSLAERQELVSLAEAVGDLDGSHALEHRQVGRPEHEEGRHGAGEGPAGRRPGRRGSRRRRERIRRDRRIGARP